MPLSFPPFSLNQPQHTVTVSGNRLPHRTPKKCFWHANGELNCKTIQILPNSESPETHVHFDSFGVPNQNYKPNAYHTKEPEINKHGTPCCSVPCNGCSPHVNSHFNSPQSPPRTPSDQNSVHVVQNNETQPSAQHVATGHHVAGHHHTNGQPVSSHHPAAQHVASHVAGYHGVHNGHDHSGQQFPMHQYSQHNHTSATQPYTGAGSDHLSS